MGFFLSVQGIKIYLCYKNVMKCNVLDKSNVMKTFKIDVFCVMNASFWFLIIHPTLLNILIESYVTEKDLYTSYSFL